MPIKYFKLEDVHADEREIQKAFEENLGDIDETGLRYVASFVPVGTGVIDTLAVDEDINPVIIEFKKPGGFDRDALFQLMNYYSWFVSDENHMKYLREVILKAKPELAPLQSEITDEIRLVAVVRSVTDDVKNACYALYPSIQIIEYRWFKQADGSVAAAVISRFEPAKEAKREIKPPKPLDDHFKRKAVKPLYDIFMKRVREVTSPHVFEKSTQYYINIYTRPDEKGFLGVWPAKRWIDLEARVVMDSPRFETWTADTAWGQAGEGSSLRIEKSDEIDDVLLGWIKRAYERALT